MTEHHDRSDPSVQRQLAHASTPPLDRYDVLLWAIPAAFLLALLLAGLLGVPLQAALTGASALGGLAIAHGVYLDPPVPEH